MMIPNEQLNKLDITYKDLNEIQVNSNNPRDHSPAQMRKLRAAIREFGLVQPILINEGNHVIAGNARLNAARDLGMSRVPCIVLSHLSEMEQKAYAIADNRIAEEGSWNNELLGQELRLLADQELSFELETIGFETAELDFHLTFCAPDDLDQDEGDSLYEGASLSEAEENSGQLVPNAEPITKAGDLWLCGPHRILCGDACSSEDLNLLMDSCKADMVFTDPPYNVPISGHVRGKDLGHREFAEASGEMTSEEFTQFLTRFMKNALSVSRDGALHYICMDWRHMSELLGAGKPLYTDLLNLCVWNKNNGGMGSFYRSKHELVFVWKAGKAPHLNNVQLGKHGRYRTNVWDYAGVNSFGTANSINGDASSRASDLADHPTVKPTDMVLDAILDCTKRGERVLDPFLGSGTTLLAAERGGRIAYGIEKDPAYVDVALRRWNHLTGDIPINAVSGKPWVNPAHNDALSLTETGIHAETDLPKKEAA